MRNNFGLIVGISFVVFFLLSLVIPAPLIIVIGIIAGAVWGLHIRKENERVYQEQERKTIHPQDKLTKEEIDQLYREWRSKK